MGSGASLDAGLDAAFENMPACDRERLVSCVLKRCTHDELIAALEVRKASPLNEASPLIEAPPLIDRFQCEEDDTKVTVTCIPGDQRSLDGDFHTITVGEFLTRSWKGDVDRAAAQSDNVKKLLDFMESVSDQNCTFKLKGMHPEDKWFASVCGNYIEISIIENCSRW